MSLGRHIRIERSLSSVQHYVRDSVTGDLILVAIHPDQRALYAEGECDPTWCPFLRKDADGIFNCTIYETRPKICQDFRCRTMVIYDREGREVGHISGKTSLSTADPALAVLWQDLAGITKKDDSSWIETVRCGLQRHGYTIEPLT
jgi:hypothetical protein